MTANTVDTGRGAQIVPLSDTVMPVTREQC